MALTECPECGKDISSQATACPHCGFPAGNAPPKVAPPPLNPPSVREQLEPMSVTPNELKTDASKGASILGSIASSPTNAVDNAQRRPLVYRVAVEFTRLLFQDVSLVVRGKKPTAKTYFWLTKRMWIALVAIGAVIGLFGSDDHGMPGEIRDAIIENLNQHNFQTDRLSIKDNHTIPTDKVSTLEYQASFEATLSDGRTVTGLASYVRYSADADWQLLFVHVDGVNE